MEEIWKDIPGYEGKYQVSNLGQVKSLDYHREKKTKLLKQIQTNKGYKRISLLKNGKIKKFFVHRLVAICFIENPDNLNQINHKDENKANNRVDNLEWCTAKYNTNYGTGHSRCVEKQKVKVKCYNLIGKLVKVYDSINDTKKDGFNPSCVCWVCKGKRHTHYGYRFDYA